MSRRIDKSWLVFLSIENFEHDRCVDLFSRPDGTHGFEEFRRDPEDRGDWTPVQYYSGGVYSSREAALAAAQQLVAWLAEAIRLSPSAQRLLRSLRSENSRRSRRSTSEFGTRRTRWDVRLKSASGTEEYAWNENRSSWISVGEDSRRPGLWRLGATKDFRPNERPSGR